MKELTDIVWPEILKLARQEIKTAWSQGGVHLIMPTNVGWSIDRVCRMYNVRVHIRMIHTCCSSVYSGCLYMKCSLHICCSVLVLSGSCSYCSGYKVSILDAAVLLEAEWDRHCHEVWVSVIPRSEVRMCMSCARTQTILCSFLCELFTALFRFFVVYCLDSLLFTALFRFFVFFPPGTTEGD